MEFALRMCCRNNECLCGEYAPTRRNMWMVWEWYSDDGWDSSERKQRKRVMDGAADASERASEAAAAFLRRRRWP